MSEALGLPLQRVYALANNRQIPVIRLGRAMRFDPRVVAEWLAGGGTGDAREEE